MKRLNIADIDEILSFVRMVMEIGLRMESVLVRDEPQLMAVSRKDWWYERAVSECTLVSGVEHKWLIGCFPFIFGFGAVHSVAEPT